MLVLSRKQGQQILIGDGIIVTLLAVKGGRVRLGIEADEDVSVNRHELLERHLFQNEGHFPPAPATTA